MELMGPWRGTYSSRWSCWINLEGDLEEDLKGDLEGDIEGDIEGDLEGDLEEDLEEDLEGDLDGVNGPLERDLLQQMELLD